MVPPDDAERVLAETLEKLQEIDGDVYADLGDGRGGEVHSLVPVPAEPRQLDDPRLTDVDEWGRSEHMRMIARRLYDPFYRRWFRAEWEGLEKIPSDGG